MVSLFNVVCWTHVAEEIARGISTGASLAFWGHRSSRSQCPPCAPVIHCAKEAPSRDLHVSLFITFALVVGFFFGVLLCICIQWFFQYHPLTQRSSASGVWSGPPLPGNGLGRGIWLTDSEKLSGDHGGARHRHGGAD